MDDLIIKIQEYLPAVLQVLGAIVLAATAIVKVTPSPKDDVAADSIAAKFFKAVSYLPTIGINPRTKKIEEAYKDLKGQQ
jgi:hypothetical protein